jgi:hypothetical protein
MATVRNSRRSIKLPAPPVAAAGPAPKKVPPPTADQISEYKRVSAERAELDRASRSLKKAEELLRDQIMDWMKQAGRTSATRCGFNLAIVDGARYPSWKDEFVRLAGEAAAEAVTERTAPSKRLIVE